MGAYDLGDLGPATVASSGLSGLLEAYKMKMAQDTEAAKIKQSGFNAGTSASLMMPFHLAALGEKANNDAAARATAQQVADQNARTASPTGGFVKSPDGKAYWDGKGWKPMPGNAAALHNQTGADLLDAISTQWDKLGAGNDPASATLVGTQLKAKSYLPSTAAGQYDANVQALAGKLDHDLLGRVNDLTIANAKKSIPGFFDTPTSKANKMAYLKKIYSTVGTTPNAGALGADPIDVPMDDSAAPAASGPMATLRSSIPAPAPAPSVAAVPTLQRALGTGAPGAGSMFRIRASDGSMHDVPDINAARKIDPNLTVVSQ